MQEVFSALEKKSEDLQTIKREITDTEMMAQAAEEAIEYAHALMKYRRAVDGANPTDISIIEAEEHLQEETGDLLLMMYMVGIDAGEAASTIYKKVPRWKKRLNIEDY
jgi:NTP pyrophosphatase (non-canonical NTP hydrolase)